MRKYLFVVSRKIIEKNYASANFASREFLQRVLSVNFVKRLVDGPVRKIEAKAACSGVI